MIESYNIIITEIDDPEIAVEELQGQIRHLRKNTVGIVAVHSDFIKSGTYDAVVEKLPFLVIGSTSISQATSERAAMYLFSILVLTSDDCAFSLGMSDAIPPESDVSEVTVSCYNRLKAELPGKNKLTLFFVPPMVKHCSYEYISVLTEIDGDVPIFGTTTSEEAFVLYESLAICGKEKYTDRFAMLLISGDISPRFYMASIGESDVVLPKIGQITKSAGNILQEINNISVIDFFENYGYQIGENMTAGLLTSTVLIDHVSKDGSVRKVGRSMHEIRDGAGVCLGNVPEGSVISIAYATPGSVMATSKQLISEIKKNHKEGTVLIYTCMGRFYALLSKPLQEFLFISDELKDKYTYLAACSNGEICPVAVDENCADNQEHNHTIIACVL